MNRLTLGKNGPQVSALGLGCMAISDVYGPTDESEGIATIHAALDAGINLLDIGDFYGMCHNEMLLRKGIEGGATRSTSAQRRRLDATSLGQKQRSGIAEVISRVPRVA